MGYIDQSVNVRGDHSLADWDMFQPEANPTTLDAQGLGRVLYITGIISPTIDGLRITGGDAQGLGGSPWGDDIGGRIFIDRAAAAVSGCVISGNTADRAGGVWLRDSEARLHANAIRSNTAEYAGGGLWLHGSPALVHGNRVAGNEALYGGGVILINSQAILSRNTIIGNRAGAEGGGVSLSGSDATFLDNVFAGNIVQKHEGGGIALYVSNAVFVNHAIIDNQANTFGSGVYMRQSTAHFLHTTIARNCWNTPGADGIGIYVTGSQYTTGYYPSSLWMTNTVILSHSVGVVVTAGDSSALNTTLRYENMPNWAGEGTVNSINGLRGMPMFAADGYHLRASSGGEGSMESGVRRWVPTFVLSRVCRFRFCPLRAESEEVVVCIEVTRSGRWVSEGTRQ